MGASGDFLGECGWRILVRGGVENFGGRGE